MKALGIYVHIPFCLQKCLYCDFLSAPSSAARIGRYVEALCRELDLCAAFYKGYTVRTVFLGGGTPSVLSPAQMEDIFSHLHGGFEVEGEAEITVEMNPGTVTTDKLSVCRSMGVNRISLGLQSADNRELGSLGRIHTWESFLESYGLCRQMGFTNLNIDLMSGLPGQTMESWMETLRRVSALEAEHISAYSLILEEGTPFYDTYVIKNGARALPLPDEETEYAMYLATRQYLADQGYRRYEISNYAKPGRECRHNCIYWMRGDYAGFGLGAASMVSNRRWSNERDLDTYLERWGKEDKGDGGGYDGGYDEREAVNLSVQRKPEEGRYLSIGEQMEETMYLGLRMTGGISRGNFCRTFGHMPEAVYGGVLEKHRAAGLLEYCGDSIRLTERGMDVSNYVLADFLLT